MTNILATILISIVTNVTTDVGVPCDGCAMWGMMQGSIFIPGHDSDCPEKSLPRDTKRETTEVVEVRTLRFTWDDQEYTTEQRRVLSTKDRRWNWTWVEEE